MDKDSRENDCQKGERKEDVLGINKGPGPHPWVSPGCALSREVLRLSRDWILVIRRIPSSGSQGRVKNESSCFFRRHVARPRMARLAHARR